MTELDVLSCSQNEDRRFADAGGEPPKANRRDADHQEERDYRREHERSSDERGAEDGGGLTFGPEITNQSHRYRRKDHEMETRGGNHRHDLRPLAPEKDRHPRRRRGNERSDYQPGDDWDDLHDSSDRLADVFACLHEPCEPWKRDPPQRGEEEERNLENPIREAPYTERGNTSQSGDNDVDPLVAEQVNHTHCLVAESEGEKWPHLRQ